MSQLVYRSNLSSAQIPLQTSEFGRSVIMSRGDQNYVAPITSKADSDKGVGVPQIYYAHNVMPSNYGYQSVDFSTQLPAADSFEFDYAFDLVASTGEKAYLAVLKTGELYVANSSTGYQWSKLILTFPAGKTVTKTETSGVTYFGVESVGVYSYDFTAEEPLVEATLIGLSETETNGFAITDFLGVFSCKGYLLVYSHDTVAWSSLIDPLDFTPSLATGAGGGSIEGARGPISKCVGFSQGFFVFTRVNGIVAMASGNERYPFNFRAIPNCGGLSDLNLCSEETEDSSVFAITTFGLQKITALKAVTMLPELTDFITGKSFEDFDSSVNLFSKVTLANPMVKRIAFIGGRYLIVSYGIETLTHAIIWDTALQRMGKIKFDHSHCFLYGFLDADSGAMPQKQIAFLQADGTVKTLDFYSTTAKDSVALLGKFQHVRVRHLKLHSVELESIDSDGDFTLFDLPTLDGKTFLPAVPGYLITKAAETRKYLFNVIGVNHSILCKGAFKLNSILLTYSNSGAR